MWHADYFAHCDKCNNSEFMDGRTLRDAKLTARKDGWFVDGKKAICPKCRYLVAEESNGQKENNPAG